MKKYLSMLVFFVGFVLTMIGIFVKQEHVVVLNKAIKICLECIGVG